MSEILEALKKRRDEILKRNEGWQKCRDGSYEQALWESGYFQLCEQIRLLEENNGKTDVTSSGNEHKDSQR